MSLPKPAAFAMFAREPLAGLKRPHGQPAPETTRILRLLGRELLGLSASGWDGYSRAKVLRWQNGCGRIGFQPGSEIFNIC